MTIPYGTPGCMGGWCLRREHCARYVQEHGRGAALERLCATGGHLLFVPLARVRAFPVVPPIPLAEAA